MNRPDDIQTGRVISWRVDKGYGFIETGRGNSVFVHVSQCKEGEPLEYGQRVAFTVGKDRQGRIEAKGVEVISRD